MSPHWLQCAKWFSTYLSPKSGIWARWKSPFWRFSASFSHKYDVTDAILRDNEKWKCNIFGVFCSICLKSYRLFRTWQRNFAWFQISLLWQPKSTQLFLIEKTKGLLFKPKRFQKIIWNSIVELLLHVLSFFEKKMMKHFSYCEKTIVFCF